jgi:hypothetical protein
LRSATKKKAQEEEAAKAAESAEMQAALEQAEAELAAERAKGQLGEEVGGDDGDDEEGEDEDGEEEEDEAEDGPEGQGAEDTRDLPPGSTEEPYRKPKSKRKRAPVEPNWEEMEQDEYNEMANMWLQKEDSDPRKQGSQRWSTRHMEVLIGVISGMDPRPLVKEDWDKVAVLYNKQMDKDAKDYAKDKTKPHPGRQRTGDSIYQKWMAKPPSTPTVVTGNPVGHRNNPLHHRQWQVWFDYAKLKGEMNSGAGGASGGFQPSAAGSAGLARLAAHKAVHASQARSTSKKDSSSSAAAAALHAAGAGAGAGAGSSAGAGLGAGAGGGPAQGASSSSSSAAAADAQRRALESLRATSTFPLPAGAPRSPFTLTAYLAQELDPGRRKGGPPAQRNQPRAKARVDDIGKLLAAALEEPVPPPRRAVDVEQDFSAIRTARQTQFEQDVRNLKLDHEMGEITAVEMRTKYASIKAALDTDFLRIDGRRQEALKELAPAPPASASGAAKRAREEEEEEEGAK